MVTLQALSARLVLTVLLVVCGSVNAATDKPATIKLAMLHLSLSYAELEANHALIEKATRRAADEGAQWIVTPELALTGYRFDMVLGTDWIEAGADGFVRRLQLLADELNIVLFLSHLEENKNDGKRYNTMFVIDRQGEIMGKHYKINTIPISEDWSTPGMDTDPIEIDGHSVGLLICADAWPEEHAQSLKRKGAQLIISSASWAPGEYGPGDTWEKRSKQTKLPVFVANKTGTERNIDLRGAVSAVSVMGQRVISHTSDESTILLVDWNQVEQRVEHQRVFNVEQN